MFVDSLFLGVEMSEKLAEVDFSVLEKLLCEFPCDMNSHRASYFCGIICKNFKEWTFYNSFSVYSVCLGLVCLS